MDQYRKDINARLLDWRDEYGGGRGDIWPDYRARIFADLGVVYHRGRLWLDDGTALRLIPFEEGSNLPGVVWDDGCLYSLIECELDEVDHPCDSARSAWAEIFEVQPNGAARLRAGPLVATAEYDRKVAVEELLRQAGIRLGRKVTRGEFLIVCGGYADDKDLQAYMARKKCSDAFRSTADRVIAAGVEAFIADLSKAPKREKVRAA